MINISVGRHGMAQVDDPDTRDPRGLIWIYEEPRPNAQYVVSCDPSYGITGWSRDTRREDDIKTDNCSIGVIRIGNPDVEVAEYAGPIDAEDAAGVVNFMGRLYSGSDPDQQAHCIVEVQPGPGLLTQRELMNRYGYENLFIWKHLDQMNVKPTSAFGWYSSRQSRQALWIRGTRHIHKQKVIINSPWLVEEMADCVLDNFLSFTARAQWGSHDDRVVKLLMGIWAANEWSFDNPPEEAQPAQVQNLPDYQAQPVTVDEMYESWNEKTDRMFS